MQIFIKTYLNNNHSHELNDVCYSIARVVLGANILAQYALEKIK